MPYRKEAEGWIFIEEEDYHRTQWEIVAENDFKCDFDGLPPDRKDTYAEILRKPAIQPTPTHPPTLTHTRNRHNTINPTVTSSSPSYRQHHSYTTTTTTTSSSSSSSSSSLSSLSSSCAFLVDDTDDLLVTRRLRNLENSARSSNRISTLMDRLHYDDRIQWSRPTPEKEPNRYEYKITIEGRREPLEFYTSRYKPWASKNHLLSPCWCKRGHTHSKSRGKGSKDYKRDFQEQISDMTRTLDYY